MKINPNQNQWFKQYAVQILKSFKSAIAMLFVLTCTTQAVASEVTEEAAFNLFSKRLQDYEISSQARQMYATLAKETKDQEKKLFFLSQMLRLDVYRAAMIPGVSIDDQKSALNQCLEDVKMIDPEQEQYYYYKLSCIGFRAKLENLLGRAWYGGILLTIQDSALKKTTKEGQLVGGVEGGGILRVMSAVRSNPAAASLGLYNANEAVSFAEKALASQKMKVLGMASVLSGRDYIENHFFLAQAQVMQIADNDDPEDKKAALLTTVSQNVNRVISDFNDLIDLGEIPAFRLPEVQYYLSRMVDLNKLLSECLDSKKSVVTLKNKLG